MRTFVTSWLYDVLLQTAHLVIHRNARPYNAGLWEPEGSDLHILQTHLL